MDRDPDFGWIAYGGAVEHDGDELLIRPRDPARRRVVARELGIDILSPGTAIDHVTVDLASREATAFAESGGVIADVRDGRRGGRGRGSSDAAVP